MTIFDSQGIHKHIKIVIQMRTFRTKMEEEKTDTDTNKTILVRGGVFICIVYGSKEKAVDHWLSQHDSLNKFDLCVMLSIWIKFEAELKCTWVYTQCRWQWSSKIYLFMHCKTNAYKSRCLPAHAHEMDKQSQQQRSPNESMFTYIVHDMHMIFFLRKKKPNIVFEQNR